MIFEAGSPSVYLIIKLTALLSASIVLPLSSPLSYIAEALLLSPRSIEVLLIIEGLFIVI